MTTTSATIDLAPLLTLGQECEAWALRFASDQAPAEPEWAAFEQHYDQVVRAFVASALEFADGERRAVDALWEYASAVTNVTGASVLAEEAYEDVYADRSLLRLLTLMHERGADVETLRATMADCDDDVTDDGRRAALEFIGGLS